MSAFSDYAGTLLAAAPASEIWVRPSEWLDLPTMADTDQRVVILHRVASGEANRVAVIAQGNYTVDWGDGSAPVNVASGVTAEYAYTYDDPDLLASEMADGTQQAIISITPQAAQNLTKLVLHVRHSAAPAGYYASGIMDVAVSGPSMTVLRFGRTDAGTSIKLVDFAHLRQASLYIPAVTDVTYLLHNLTSLRAITRLAIGAGITNATSMLQSCTSLQSLPSGMTLANVTNATSMLQSCTSLQSLPSGMTLASVTNATQMLQNCFALQSLPSGMTLASVTNATQMLFACTSLQSLPSGMTLANVTNATSMLNSCTSLQSLPSGMTLASVTTTTTAFTGCSSLQRAQGLAIPVTFSISSCNFGAAALDELYTSLPTVVGQTITVTGNPGISGDTPAIATGKGWTVTGS